MKRFLAAVLMLLLIGTTLVAQDAADFIDRKEIESERSEKEMPVKVKLNTDFPEMEEKVSFYNASAKFRAALNESFEGSFPPPGWIAVCSDPATGWEQTSYQAYTGTYSAYQNDYNASSQFSSWLITPELVISAGSDTLKYWQYENYATWMTYHGIWIDTTASSDTSNFFEYKSLPAGPEDTWEMLAETLSAYTGDTIRLAFNYKGDFSDEWYIDDVSGVDYIEPPDTIGPSISILEFPESHFASGLTDSVLARITDPNEVDTAIVSYSVDAGTTWTDIAMTSAGTDSFLGEIPPQSRGTMVYYGIIAMDTLGNVSYDPSGPTAYSYSIYPTSENLIVTEYNYGELTGAFNNLGYSYDYMDQNDVEIYEDSVVALWKTMWYRASGSIDSTRVLRRFLEYTTGADSADRHALFIAGDDIAEYTSNGTRKFIEKYFKCEYIYDDPTSIDDDTIVGIPGDPITDGMPSYGMDSYDPDFVLTNARVYGDSADMSYPFQYMINADSTNTPAGIRYNGLTYVSAYMPYDTDEFVDSTARDTLIKRLMNAIQAAPMPEFVDAAMHVSPAHEYGVAGDTTSPFVGYAVEPGAGSSDIIAQIGAGPLGSYPMDDTLWNFDYVNFDSTVGDTFFFSNSFVLPDTTQLPAGDYSVAFRFSLNNGPWIYADLDGYARGFDYQFDPAMAGTLTVLESWAYPDIKINEVLYDTEGGDDSLYTELKGPPGASLDNFTLVGINGYNGSVYHTIDLSGDTIMSDSFYVISTDTVPYADKIADVDWQNGDDNIQLWYAGGVVEALGYGSYDTTSWVFMGEGMPAPDVIAGHALYRDPVDDGNNIMDFAGSGALSPGAHNPGPAYTTISDIQGMGPSTPYEDTLVTAMGIATVATNWGLFLQDSPGPWNGVFVDNWDDYPVTSGDSIGFLASPIEDYSETRLVDRSFVANFGSPSGGIDQYQTTCGNVDTNEALEGVLVELNMVTVIDTSLSYGEWLVSDGTDTCKLDDYYSYTYPGEGEVISILRGPVAYTFGEYKIEPRGDWDIQSLDLAVDTAYSPDTLGIGSAVTPYAWVTNYGDTYFEPANVYFMVDSMGTVIYADTEQVWVDGGTTDTVTFGDWTPGFEGNVTLKYEADIDYDLDETNDLYEHSVFLSGLEVTETPKVFSLSVPGITVGNQRIKYAVPEKANISINLYDKLGRRAAVLVNGEKSPGYYEVDMNRLNLPAGVYFVSMKSNSFKDLKKVVILR